MLVCEAKNLVCLGGGRVVGLILRRESAKTDPVGSKCFYLSFNCCPAKVLYLSKINYYICLFEILKMLHCKGGWLGAWMDIFDPFDFFYVC